MYAISTRGLQDDLKVAEPDVTQTWFADDNAAGARISSLKSYWDTINDIGPPYGFHPKASKCILIVKDAEMREQAEASFAGTGVWITTEGERHIGAALGSEAFKLSFVTAKVKKWVQDVDELAKNCGRRATVRIECIQLWPQQKVVVCTTHNNWYW